MMIECTVCHASFERKGSRGPVPKYCSQPCRTKANRTEERKEYERNYRRQERLSGKRAEYEFEYNRRPSVRLRNKVRMAEKSKSPEYKFKRSLYYRRPEVRTRYNRRYSVDPRVRARQAARYDKLNPYRKVEIPSPYTGHRWLQMAKDAVAPMVNHDSLWAEQYYDEMGEAVLALLEGRDMKQAVKDYRRKEYIPRHLTMHIGDWGDDEDQQNKFFEKIMPTVESAEDEAIANETVQFYVKSKYKGVSKHAGGRGMKHKTSQPTNRRMNNGKGWRRTGRLG